MIDTDNIDKSCSILFQILTHKSTTIPQINYTQNFISKIDEIFDQVAKIESIAGELNSVEYIGTNTRAFRLIFDRTIVPCHFALKDNTVLDIQLYSGAPRFESIRSIEKTFKSLQGEVSLLIQLNGLDILAINPDKPLAISSSFKMFILNKYRKFINLNLCRKDDLIFLDKKDIAFPTGQMRNWPIGTPITLETLAIHMISNSDNTAADIMQKYMLGIDPEFVIDKDYIPFFNTKAVHLIKSPTMTQIKSHWLSSESSRREIATYLSNIDIDSIDKESIWPESIEVNWFHSCREMCALVQKLQFDPILSINPDPIIRDPKNWKDYSYKGGSSFGIYNATVNLLDHSENIYTFSATHNNSLGIDANIFISLCQGIVFFLENVSKINTNKTN